MIKVLHFGLSCKAYLRFFANQSPDVKICCPDCGRVLHKHGKYKRNVTTKQQVITLPIYRQYCPDCGMTVSLLPDFLVPRARHVTWVREAAMKRRRQGFSWREIIAGTTHAVTVYSRSTLKRWWKRFVHRAGEAASKLAGEIVAAGTKLDLLGMYPDKVAPTPLHTLVWLERLCRIHAPAMPWRRGDWAWLNPRLPQAAQL